MMEVQKKSGRSSTESSTKNIESKNIPVVKERMIAFRRFTQLVWFTSE